MSDLIIRFYYIIGSRDYDVREIEISAPNKDLWDQITLKIWHQP
jgi:hypothetical protein